MVLRESELILDINQIIISLKTKMNLFFGATEMNPCLNYSELVSWRRK